MRSGSGQQFKILEAMASGAPVVATSAEADQVGARSGQDLLVADAATDFAEAVVTLIRDTSLADRLTRQARRLVEERFTWDRSVGLLETAYREAVAPAKPRPTHAVPA